MSPLSLLTHSQVIKSGKVAVSVPLQVVSVNMAPRLFGLNEVMEVHDPVLFSYSELELCNKSIRILLKPLFI